MKILYSLLLISCSSVMADGIESSKILAQNNKINAELTYKKVDKLFCDYFSGWLWGNGDLPCPKSHVSKIKIHDGDISVFIPLFSFFDLGNPNSISINNKNEKGEFSININGGDAAGSYNAMLFIKDGFLTKRVVTSGEFPDDFSETTIYKFNNLNN